MKLKHMAIILLIVFMAGCVSKQMDQAVVYSRTKDIRFSGSITVPKGEPMLSVTWKYAKQNITPDKADLKEETQDCFRSELVYNGITEDAIQFLIKNYVCGTYNPVSVETMIFEPKLPIKLTFHSVDLKILKADHASLDFESTP
jgi:hypothetical protein